MIRLFDLTLIFSGFPIRTAQRQFDAIVAIPESGYSYFSEQARLNIAQYHIVHNAFYREISGMSMLPAWEQLPVLCKKDLQRPLSSRLSVGYKPGKVYVNKTSGSSGAPFIFAKDKYCHALTWASYIWRFGWYGIDFNRALQARFYGIPKDFVGYHKERLKDRLSNRYRFPIFDLSDTVLEKYLHEFKVRKFDYINGYTSAIVLFAKYLLSKNIVLHDLCPTLKVCMVTSEMLFDEDRLLLQQQLGIPIVNEYGASELDLIAFENISGEWQVNSETLYVEILDAQDNVLPYGEEGRIVITALYNKAHPFVRYDIGDIGVLHPHSTAKKPILKRLTGRTNDIAILPSGKKSPGLTFYYITKTVIEQDGNVKEFVITQVKTDRFVIEYVSDRPLSEFDVKNVEAAAALYLEPGLHFEFVRKSLLQRSARGKLKQFTAAL